MLDNRDGISYEETVDPNACNLPKESNWQKASRDPERKCYKILNIIDFFEM